MSVTAPTKLHAIVERTAYPPLLSSDLFGEVKKLATPREMEIMQLFDEGLNLKQMAARLGISKGRIGLLRDSLRRKITRAKQILATREKVNALISPNNQAHLSPSGSGGGAQKGQTK